MSISVPFDLTYEFEAKAPFKNVFDVLADVPTSASHFPKLARLLALGDNAYRWELEKVGTEKIHIQTIYTSRYVADRKKGTISWAPVPDGGTAEVSGRWTVTDRKTSTHLRLHLNGQIGAPLPALTKALAGPVIVRENEKLVEKYIDNLIERFGGEA